MIPEPQCHTRQCKHFRGVTNIREDGEESGERPWCFAFPAGIPQDIAYGNNPHLEPVDGQFGDIFFEEGSPLVDEGR